MGTGHALLYEAWAHQLERERKFTEAGQIYEVPAGHCAVVDRETPTPSEQLENPTSHFRVSLIFKAKT